MRDDIVKASIADRGGGGADAGQTADAVAAALSLLFTQLSSVVGTQAAAALCAHALHRTRAKMGWTIAPTAAITDKTLAELRQDLADRTPVDSLVAGESLLLSLVDHLISLIGEPLTSRMLHSAWTASDPTQTSQENL